MTITYTAFIFCDACGKEGKKHVSEVSVAVTHKLRLHGKSVGWSFTHEEGDLCPPCSSQKGKRKIYHIPKEIADD